MEILEKAVLGVVQGLTEFLPVSSSGHLVLARDLLGVEAGSGPVLEASLHIGTLLAILLFFRHDVAEVLRGALALVRDRSALESHAGARLFVQIIVASVPAAVVGLTFRSFLEDLFTSSRGVGLCLLATGCVLVATRLIRPRQGRGSLSNLAAFGVGVAQAVAIMPGISRSGLTIAAALALGAGRTDAARFSFLIAIPATMGAFVLELALHGMPRTTSPAALIVATMVAAVVGYLALLWLTRWVRQGRLHWFAVYLVPLGILALLA